MNHLLQANNQLTQKNKIGDKIKIKIEEEFMINGSIPIQYNNKIGKILYIDKESDNYTILLEKENKKIILPSFFC